MVVFSSFRNPDVLEKYLADSFPLTSAAWGFTISRPCKGEIFFMRTGLIKH